MTTAPKRPTGRRSAKPKTEAPKIELFYPFAGDGEGIPVLQPFGGHPDVYKRFGQKGHPGVDFALYVAPVLAAHDGVVEFAGDGGEWPVMGSAAGQCIVLEADDYRTGYAHLSRVYVGVGEHVTAGQVIGISGNTGAVTGHHLHFDLMLKPLDMKNGYAGRTDPMPYLTKRHA
jgi:murein DD-endopeptidase MepM/ murein hydrolase activator NlpD